jgi:dephospho-CoA kinase
VVEWDIVILGNLARIFGVDIIGSDKKLDRRLLARRAFSSPEKTRLLNEAVHPQLIGRILEMITFHRNTGGNTIVDCALIYEWGIEKNFDRIICVRADEAIRRSRLTVRDNRSPEEIDRLFSVQLPEDEKVLKADIVFANNGSREELTAYGLMIGDMPRFLRESETWEN